MGFVLDETGGKRGLSKLCVRVIRRLNDSWVIVVIWKAGKMEHAARSQERRFNMNNIEMAVWLVW